MRIDVIHLIRPDPRPLQRGRHGPESPIAILARRGDVIGIPRKAIAQHLGIDLRAARLGMLVFLKHHHTRALAHHESVAIRVIGAGCLGRILRPLRGQRLAGVEPGNPDLADGALRPARQHHIGIPPLDQPRRIANGMGAGGTGRDDGMVRPLEAEADRDLPRNQVDQRAGNEEGRNALRPLFLDQDGGFGNRGQPPDPRSDHHARPQTAFLVFRHPARIPHRLLGGGHAVEDEIIHLAAILRFHPVIGIEGAIAAIAERDLAGILRDHVRRIETRDRPRARLPRQQPLPGLFHPAGQRRDQTQTRDDNPTHSAPP